MSLLKCSQCGELYADSYRSCPFCAEDEEFYRGNVKKKRQHRDGRKKSPSIIGPMMILILALIVGVVLWGAIGQGWFGGGAVKDNTDTPAVQDDATASNAAPTVELMMDTTLRIAPGETTTLTVSGGTSYEWSSSDKSVAEISNSGVLQAIANGTAIITVTDESGATAVCSVTVTDEPEETDKPTGTEGQTEDKPTGNKPVATKVDVTKLKITTIYGTELPKVEDGVFATDISQKEGSYQLTVEGTSSAVKWSSGNSNVVTIDSEGNLTWVGKGTADVTAKVGDATLTIHVTAK